MNLLCSYNVISSFLTKFGLIIEYMKTKVFYFSKIQRVFNPPLNLTFLGGLILYLENTWCYLGFIFDWKLLFQQYIDFYANKVILTIKYMKILGNSSKGLDPIQKRYLYRYCILLIALYSFQLWYYNKVLLVYPLKELRKIQRRVAIWITGVFHTSPTLDIKVIAGLISIYLYLQKLNGRFYLQVHLLPPNHIINSILDLRDSSNQELYQLSLDKLMPR